MKFCILSFDTISYYHAPTRARRERGTNQIMVIADPSTQTVEFFIRNAFGCVIVRKVKYNGANFARACNRIVRKLQGMTFIQAKEYIPTYTR